MWSWMLWQRENHVCFCFSQYVPGGLGWVLIYSLRKPLWQGIILTCFAFSPQAFVAGYCLCLDLVPEWLLAICNLSAPGLDGLHVPSSAANEVRRYSTNAGWILENGNGFEPIAANPPGREDIWSSAFPLLAVPCQTRNIFGVFFVEKNAAKCCMVF